MFAYRKQPWKFLYLFTQIAFVVLVRIPWWIVSNLPPSNRPRPSWSLWRVCVVKMSRTVFGWSYAVGRIRNVPTHQAIRPGEGFEGVWIRPVPELILGEIKGAAQKNGVASIPIPGYWIHRPGSTVNPGAAPLPGEKVMMCLHGGSYIALSAHPTDFTANIAHGVLRHCKSVTRTFSPEYRLSRAAPYKPAGGFPSALIDALAGYNYLVNDVGFDPHDIIIEGDSAGGNLALALVRYLVEYAGYDPLNPLPGVPGALLLLSPWTDLGSSHNNTVSTKQNIPIDFIDYHPERFAYAARALTASLGVALIDTYRYISPGSKCLKDISFQGFPTTFIAAGGAEMLVDQIVTLKDRMKDDLGDEQVNFFFAPDAVHDYICIPYIEPESTETLKSIDKWLSRE